MKRIIVIYVLAAVLMAVFSFPVSGAEDTTVNLTLEPDEKGGEYLPALESDAIDVKMTSNIPVDVYVISQENAYDAMENDDFDYEKKWSQRKSLNVDYTVEDPEQLYFIMVHNTHDSETAEVELEYKIYQELAEEIAEDAVEDACCGGIVVAGTGILLSIVALASLLKRRN